jgi:predicted nucleic acid-binding protein
VSDTWVANASPVIALAKAGQLNLLASAAGELVLPEAVVAEILAGPASDPARQALEAGWGHRVAPRNVPTAVLEWSLGAGETSVLAVALERPGSVVILDDAEARMCARTLGVPCVGTLGVVLRAKQNGHIASAAAVMRALRTAGLFLDDTLLRTVLQRVVGERWDL